MPDKPTALEQKSVLEAVLEADGAQVIEAGPAAISSYAELLQILEEPRTRLGPYSLQVIADLDRLGSVARLAIVRAVLDGMTDGERAASMRFLRRIYPSPGGKRRYQESDFKPRRTANEGGSS